MLKAQWAFNASAHTIVLSLFLKKAQSDGQSSFASRYTNAVALAFWKLQTWGEFLTFGGLRRVRRSKSEESLSHLEGLGLCGAPNARKVSHIWRVWGCVALQTRGKSLTFGGFEAVWRSKREESLSHLEGLRLCGAPNMGRISSVCSYNLLERSTARFKQAQCDSGCYRLFART